MTKKNIDVDHLTQLAKLTIAPEERILLTKQLETTVEYIKVLQELDTSNVQPTSQVTGQKNVSRQDQIQKGLSQEEALANATEKNGGYFVVPKIKRNE